MTYHSERRVVQETLIKYAREMGWEYINPEECLRQRRGKEGKLLLDVFISQVQKLNPDAVDFSRAEELSGQLERIHPSIEGNFASWEYLRGLRTVFVPEEKREKDVTLMDFENDNNNLYHVTDELTFYNGTHTIRADVVFFINGIPVIIIETKSASRLEGVAEAVDQLKRYHWQAPELLALLQLFNVTHLVSYYYGATWNLGRKSLFNWKDEKAGDFETLVKSFVHPQRILRVIRDFILFTRQDRELKKVVLKPHQMRATEKVLKRAEDKEKRRGLIWHTQGSGKTFTMITAAQKLIKEPRYENPTVILLVDRNELETQLYGNLVDCGIPSVEVAGTKRELKKLLENDRRGLLVSMIHKFDGMPENINTRDNIFILVDEAHRTTGGHLGNYLMGALPRATYIGFTGTPIDKTSYGKGTFKIFGTDDPEGYLDKYSIAESIEDGTTVPLHYTVAPNELQVDRETLEEEFLSLVDIEGVSDVEELNKTLEKAVTLRNMLKNKDRIEEVAKYVADHYRKYIEPLNYKAFLVGVDREACAFYKEALDKHLPTEYSRVVYSPFHNDPPHLARYHLSNEEESQVRTQFRKPEELPKILIVTEKLLTGYDAPILYCMYLDKPMRDHVLLQAIARVNRPYEDEEGIKKPAGFVVDFVGIFENLEKALKFDSQDVEGTIEDIDLLKDRFKDLMKEGKDKYLSLLRSHYSPDKTQEKILEHFRDEERRHSYYQYFREISSIYEILSPDPFLREYLNNYRDLTYMYNLLRAAYEKTPVIDPELSRKTARLVQEHSHTGAVQITLDIYEIDDKLLKKIQEDQETSDTVKVFNILKSIENLVNKRVTSEPYLIDIGERAEKIAQSYKDRQKTTQQTLEELEELIRDTNQVRKEVAEKGLSGRMSVVYWLLKPKTQNPEKVVVEMEKVFNKFPHWIKDESQSRRVRREIYKELIKEGADGSKELVDKILKGAEIVGDKNEL